MYKVKMIPKQGAFYQELAKSVFEKFYRLSNTEEDPFCLKEKYDEVMYLDEMLEMHSRSYADIFNYLIWQNADKEKVSAPAPFVFPKGLEWVKRVSLSAEIEKNIRWAATVLAILDGEAPKGLYEVILLLSCKYGWGHYDLSDLSRYYIVAPREDWDSVWSMIPEEYRSRAILLDEKYDSSFKYQRSRTILGDREFSVPQLRMTLGAFRATPDSEGSLQEDFSYLTPPIK